MWCVPRPLLSRQAGARLLKRYSTVARQPGLPELMADLRANDLTVVDVLEPALAEILPEARWLNDEHGSGPLPEGTWWLIDSRASAQSALIVQRRPERPPHGSTRG